MRNFLYNYIMSMFGVFFMGELFELSVYFDNKIVVIQMVGIIFVVVVVLVNMGELFVDGLSW